ncbi:MAG TPA: NAD(P)-dependent oxidoreductase [Steroidobacteraceae bacterium]|nr:NAD(P)-dependent oxidoreductase [Steroidobacteraceae bacterium]
MPEEFLPPERIGFVGLGNMGAPMARHLAAAGYQVVAADASPAAIERFGSSVHCERARSLRELGRSCRLVITMLPDGAAVRQVLLGADAGADAVAASLAPGSVVLDMSSSEPVGTRALALQLADAAIALVDAPVSGGVKRAVEGTLAIMAGGDEAAIARCRPLLAKLGEVFVSGPSGSGHAVKALNNYLSAVALAATAEAMLAGERFGMAPAVMLEILNHSTGRNSATEQKYPAFVLPRTFNSGFALALMAKDLRIALGLAESLGAPRVLLSECSALWDLAEQRLGSSADNTEIVKYLEKSQVSSADG